MFTTFLQQKMKNSQSLFHPIWVIGALGMIAISGCQKGPALGTVTGTVTVNGEPLPYAYVVFNPQKPPRSYGSGYANAKGQYELQFARNTKGAPVGKHFVSITAAKGDELPEDGKSLSKLNIPSKYNSNTELQVEVKPGANVFDFALVIDAN